ncbi:hypothetical protein FSP39_010919 [Pinctada imbricata]|uniref:Methyltransferase domain-containing protein n=1 Tax=Pinctada imbricata TaxID=66713 RepID=A0AA89CAG3_PINIB|nr:hypothetical protein FSP39_010919 [Pinctada imbricata]
MAEELSNSSSLYEEIVAINHQVCEKGITPEERNKRYDVISTTYDKIYADTNYKAPFSAAQTVASLYCPEQRSNISVLDIGAGTGRVACELRKVGFNIIDGLEPSQGMLEKAKQKDVYRNLYCMEISDMSLDITKGEILISTSLLLINFMNKLPSPPFFIHLKIREYVVCNAVIHCDICRLYLFIDNIHFFNVLISAYWKGGISNNTRFQLPQQNT